MGECCSKEPNGNDERKIRTTLERHISHSRSNSDGYSDGNVDGNVVDSKISENDKENSYISLTDINVDSIDENTFGNSADLSEILRAVSTSASDLFGNKSPTLNLYQTHSINSTITTPINMTKISNIQSNTRTSTFPGYVDIVTIPTEDKIEFEDNEIIDVGEQTKLVFNQPSSTPYQKELRKYLTIGYICWSIFDIKNRKYKFKTYKNCFIGNKCVKQLYKNAWYIENYLKSVKINSEQDCVNIMKKLWEFNIIKHTNGKHEFKNDKSFYIFIDPESKFKDIRRKLLFKMTTYNTFSEIETIIRNGFNCKDRTYKLSNYWNCFIGNEAIDVMIHKNIGSDRITSQIIGQILMDEGVFEHVEQDHLVFRDKKWFYHFKDYDDQ